MAYKLSELEKQLNEADRNTAVLEKNIAASEKLLEELEQSVPRAAEAVSNRFSSVRADRKREKQDSAARINELRAEKEKIEKELKRSFPPEGSLLFVLCLVPPKLILFQKHCRISPPSHPPKPQNS